MNTVWRNYLDSILIVCIDDILVYSKTKGDHMDHLKMVWRVLNEHQLFSKYRKYEFWLRSVEFLGHIISGEGKEVDPKKTKEVRNCTRPFTPTNIWSLLNLAWYYRRLIDGFASIASHLTTLTQKSEILVVGGIWKKLLKIEI